MTTKLYSPYTNRPVVLPEEPQRAQQIESDLEPLGPKAELEIWRELDALPRDDMPDDWCAFALCHARRDPVEVYLRPVGRAVMVVSVDRRRRDHRAMFHGMVPSRHAAIAAEALVRADLGLINETLETRPWMQDT